MDGRLANPAADFNYDAWKGRLDFKRRLRGYLAIAKVIQHDDISARFGGFKCFRREVLEAIHFDSVRSHGYAFQVELTYRAVRAGFRVREVPIVFRDRQRGESKMSWRIAVEAMWLVPRLRFR